MQHVVPVPLKNPHAMNEQGWLECVASPRSSSAAVSVKDSNGTFVSTLSMILYNVSTQLILRHSHLFRGCETRSILVTELSLGDSTRLILCFQTEPSVHHWETPWRSYLAIQQVFPQWIHLMFPCNNADEKTHKTDTRLSGWNYCRIQTVHICRELQLEASCWRQEQHL